MVAVYGPGNSQLQPGTYKCVNMPTATWVTNKVRLTYQPVLTTNTAAVNTILAGMRVKAHIKQRQQYRYPDG